MRFERQRVLRGAYRTVFNSPQGEKVLADLADHGCMMRSTFIAGDPNATSFSEGARGVVLRIFDMIDKDESYLRELEQRRKKEARNQGDDDE